MPAAVYVDIMGICENGRLIVTHCKVREQGLLSKKYGYNEVPVGRVWDAYSLCIQYVRYA